MTRIIKGLSPGSNGQNRHFSAEGPVAKQIIGRDNIIYKEAETVSKYDKYLISHVIVTCESKNAHVNNSKTIEAYTFIFLE